MGEAFNPKQLAQEAKNYYARGEFQTAATVYRAAADGYNTAGDALNAAEMMNNASVAHLQANDALSAISAVEGTPDIFAAAGDLRRQGMAAGNLAAGLELAGCLEEAAAAYTQSAEILKQAGETELRSSALQSLSALQLRMGRQLEALATMQAGLEGGKLSIRKRALKSLLQVPSKLLRGS